jgi:hypothetical protein
VVTIKWLRRDVDPEKLRRFLRFPVVVPQQPSETVSGRIPLSEQHYLYLWDQTAGPFSLEQHRQGKCDVEMLANRRIQWFFRNRERLNP